MEQRDSNASHLRSPPPQPQPARRQQVSAAPTLNFPAPLNWFPIAVPDSNTAPAIQQPAFLHDDLLGCASPILTTSQLQELQDHQSGSQQQQQPDSEGLVDPFVNSELKADVQYAQPQPDMPMCVSPDQHGAQQQGTRAVVDAAQGTNIVPSGMEDRSHPQLQQQSATSHDGVDAPPYQTAAAMLGLPPEIHQFVLPQNARARGHAQGPTFATQAHGPSTMTCTNQAVTPHIVQPTGHDVDQSQHAPCPSGSSAPPSTAQGAQARQQQLPENIPTVQGGAAAGQGMRTQQGVHRLRQLAQSQRYYAARRRRSAGPYHSPRHAQHRPQAVRIADQTSPNDLLGSPQQARLSHLRTRSDVLPGMGHLQLSSPVRPFSPHGLLAAIVSPRELCMVPSHQPMDPRAALVGAPSLQQPLALPHDERNLAGGDDAVTPQHEAEGSAALFQDRIVQLASTLRVARQTTNRQHQAGGVQDNLQPALAAQLAEHPRTLFPGSEPRPVVQPSAAGSAQHACNLSHTTNIGPVLQAMALRSAQASNILMQGNSLGLLSPAMASESAHEVGSLLPESNQGALLHGLAPGSVEGPRNVLQANSMRPVLQALAPQSAQGASNLLQGSDLGPVLQALARQSAVNAGSQLHGPPTNPGPPSQVMAGGDTQPGLADAFNLSLQQQSTPADMVRAGMVLAWLQGARQAAQHFHQTAGLAPAPTAATGSAAGHAADVGQPTAVSWQALMTRNILAVPQSLASVAQETTGNGEPTDAPSQVPQAGSEALVQQPLRPGVLQVAGSVAPLSPAGKTVEGMGQQHAPSQPEDIAAEPMNCEQPQRTEGSANAAQDRLSTGMQLHRAFAKNAELQYDTAVDQRLQSYPGALLHPAMQFPATASWRLQESQQELWGVYSSAPPALAVAYAASHIAPTAGHRLAVGQTSGDPQQQGRRWSHTAAQERDASGSEQATQLLQHDSLAQAGSNVLSVPALSIPPSLEQQRQPAAATSTLTAGLANSTAPIAVSVASASEWVTQVPVGAVAEPYDNVALLPVPADTMPPTAPQLTLPPANNLANAFAAHAQHALAAQRRVDSCNPAHVAHAFGTPEASHGDPHAATQAAAWFVDQLMSIAAQPQPAPHQDVQAAWGGSEPAVGEAVQEVTWPRAVFPSGRGPVPHVSAERRHFRSAKEELMVLLPQMAREGTLQQLLQLASRHGPDSGQRRFWHARPTTHSSRGSQRHTPASKAGRASCKKVGEVGQGTEAAGKEKHAAAPARAFDGAAAKPGAAGGDAWVREGAVGYVVEGSACAGDSSTAGPSDWFSAAGEAPADDLPPPVGEAEELFMSDLDVQEFLDYVLGVADELPEPDSSQRGRQPGT